MVNEVTACLAGPPPAPPPPRMVTLTMSELDAQRLRIGLNEAFLFIEAPFAHRIYNALSKLAAERSWPHWVANGQKVSEVGGGNTMRKFPDGPEPSKGGC